MHTIRATTVVPGHALAPSRRIDRPHCSTGAPTTDTPHDDYDAAVTTVTNHITDLARHHTGPTADILSALAMIAADPGLQHLVHTAIDAGTPADKATTNAINHFATLYRQQGGLMAERADDIISIGDHITAHLHHQPRTYPTITTPTTIIADTLSAIDIASLPPQHVAAVILEHGAATSHTAIIAKQYKIPLIVNAGKLTCADNTPIYTNASEGYIIIDPPPTFIPHTIVHE